MAALSADSATILATLESLDAFQRSKNEPRTKAKPAPPYEGRATWHGQYRHDGKWHTVRSAYGPIIYKTPGAAIAAAWLEAP